MTKPRKKGACPVDPSLHPRSPWPRCTIACFQAQMAKTTRWWCAPLGTVVAIQVFTFCRPEEHRERTLQPERWQRVESTASGRHPYGCRGISHLECWSSPCLVGKRIAGFRSFGRGYPPWLVWEIWIWRSEIDSQFHFVDELGLVRISAIGILSSVIEERARLRDSEGIWIAGDGERGV